MKSRSLTLSPSHRAKAILAAVLLGSASGALASNFTLAATVGVPNKQDLGLFSGGWQLTLTASGQISLITGWNTYADGSLVNPINPVGELANYNYANAGASGYPTVAGGDGINHFLGGGANYDVNAAAYGPAGVLTTDTTNPGAVRFGEIIGTFKASPTRTDWFAVGTGTTVTVPDGSAHLYIAVNDTTYGNNSGSYLGTVTVIPEPSVLSLGIIGCFAALARRRLNAGVV